MFGATKCGSGAYNVDDAPRPETCDFRDIVSFHLSSAVFGVVVFLLGWLWKKFDPHCGPRRLSRVTSLFLIPCGAVTELSFFSRC